MTKLDYLEDNYQDNAECIILDINETDGAILFDHTPVHPQGGHQASDHATVFCGDFTLTIAEAKNKSGAVWHYVVEADQLKMLKPGRRIAVKIDWLRRYQLMRLHTSQHLVSAVANQLYQLQTVDLAIEEDGCTVKFNRAPALSEIMNIQAAVNVAINKNLPVWRKNENGKYLVGIGDLDQRACGCTHIRSLSEIGQVRIGSINGLKINFNVASVANEMVNIWQSGFLFLQPMFPKGVDNIEDYVKIMEQRTNDLAAIRKERSSLGLELLNFQLESAGRSRLKIIDRPEVDIQKAREAILHYLKGKKQIILIRCINGTVLIFSTLKNRSAVDIISVLKTEDQNFKGGGNEKFAQGGPWNVNLEGLDHIIRCSFLEVSAYCD
jgi:misacylated tRNA(Ala) deacylase